MPLQISPWLTLIEISGNDDKKHDILGKLASVRSELTRKHNKPMGNLQVIEALFGKWFGDTDNRNTDVFLSDSDIIYFRY
jgi:hypothetical protein